MIRRPPRSPLFPSPTLFRSAAHWLDLPPFYAEVRRVARPGAAVALVTYGILHVEGEAEAVVDHFYRDVVGPHWPYERRHVEDRSEEHTSELQSQSNLVCRLL